MIHKVFSCKRTRIDAALIILGKSSSVSYYGGDCKTCKFKNDSNCNEYLIYEGCFLKYLFLEKEVSL